MPVQGHLLFSFRRGFSDLLADLSAMPSPLEASMDWLVLGPAASPVPHWGPFTAIPCLPVKCHTGSLIRYLPLTRPLVAQLSVLPESSI